MKILVHNWRGHPVGRLVEALRYKPEGLGFDSRWCHWKFSLTLSFRPHCGPGVDLASNRDEYQVYFLADKRGRAVGLTNLSLSFADCLEIWETEPPGNFRVCPGLYRDYFTFSFNFNLQASNLKFRNFLRLQAHIEAIKDNTNVSNLEKRNR
jgi:hypothetical protein